MGKSIAIINQKGGVGKSTTAYTLGKELTKHFSSSYVLLIDLDPTATLTFFSGIEVREGNTVLEWMGLNKDNKQLPFENVKHRISERLDIVPADITLSGAERMLYKRREDAQDYLRQQIKRIENAYDYIIIDSGPSLGMLFVNAIMASDSIIIPTKPEMASIKGLMVMFGILADIKEEFKKEIEIAGILFTMANEKTVSYKQVKEVLAEMTDGSIRIFKTAIRNSVLASNSAGTGNSIPEFAKDKPVSKDYLNFITEFLEADGYYSREEKKAKIE